jgi:hypothetical protein
MLALGDIAERCLRFFGITKDRVQAVTGKKDCGCAKRQAAMNEWGRRWQHRAMFPAYWLLERCMRIRKGRLWMRLEMAGRYMNMAFRALFCDW